MSEGMGIIGLILFLLSLCPIFAQPGMDAGEIEEPMATSVGVDVQPLIAQAQNAACADQLNALYLIDNEFVVWYRAGDCADASYGTTLFDARTHEVLCTQYDSIAGPQLNCTSEAHHPLFESLLGGIRPAMGQHTIEEIFSEGSGRRLGN